MELVENISKHLGVLGLMQRIRCSSVVLVVVDAA